MVNLYSIPDPHPTDPFPRLHHLGAELWWVGVVVLVLAIFFLILVRVLGHDPWMWNTVNKVLTVAAVIGAVFAIACWIAEL